MDNIKLSGLKKVRELKNVSLNRLARDLNLLDVGVLNKVVTPEYLAKLETRKQKSISDDLLQALSDYFCVTLDTLITGELNSHSSTLWRRVAIIGDVKGKEYKEYVMVPKILPDNLIDQALDELMNLFQPFTSKKSFTECIQMCRQFFTGINPHPEELQPLLDDDHWYDTYIHRFILNIQNKFYIKLAEIAGTINKTLWDMGLSDEGSDVLTKIILEVIIENNLLDAD